MSFITRRCQTLTVSLTLVEQFSITRVGQLFVWFFLDVRVFHAYHFVSGLWSHVFLFSNLSMFVFLPFAYLFSESSGFPGCRGLRGRVYETFIVLALLGVAMLGLAYVISAWLEGDRSSIDALLSKYEIISFLSLEMLV